MNVILLSGGSGKRLWPLSNEARAKQFLKVLKTKDGKSVSMLQKVFGQLQEANIEADVTVAAAALQVDAIRKQFCRLYDSAVQFRGEYEIFVKLWNSAKNLSIFSC